MDYSPPFGRNVNPSRGLLKAQEAFEAFPFHEKLEEMDYSPPFGRFVNPFRGMLKDQKAFAPYSRKRSLLFLSPYENKFSTDPKTIKPCYFRNKAF
jgi:hypothetical protein